MAKTERGTYENTDAERFLERGGLTLLECWARDGFIMREIAQKIGIAEKTFWQWRTKYPEMQDAMSKGKEVTDYLVENALLKSALGYKTTETKTIISGNPDKDGNRPVRVERTEKEIAPNVTACLAWLNNRKPEEWKRNRDNVMELNDSQSNITVNIIRRGKDEEEPNTDNEEWDVNTESANKAKKQSSNNAKTGKSSSAQKAQSTYSNEEEEWLAEG